MAIATITLTGNIHDRVGVAHNDARRTKVWLTTRDANGIIARIVDPASNEERYGDAVAEVQADGSYTFTNLWPTNAASNPTGYYYELHIDYPLRNPRGHSHGRGRGGRDGRDVWSSGPFSLGASANVADLDLDTPAVSATWRSEFRTYAETLLAQQEEISGLTGEDSAIAFLLENPNSDTRASLPRAIAAIRDNTPTVNSVAGLASWKARRNLALTSRINIIVQGDSITAGAWASGSGIVDATVAQGWADNGFVGRLRNKIHAMFGNLGEGLITFSAEEKRWTFSGTAPTLDRPWGAGRTGARFVDGSATATITVPGTTFEVIGIRRNGGVGSGQPLTRGGVPFLKVDGTDVTPNALTGSPVGGVAALTAGWSADGVAYSVISGENVITETTTGAGAKTLFSPLSNGNRFPVTAGTVYLVTGEVTPVGTAAKHNHQIGMRFFDASNVQVGADLLSTDGAILADVWNPVTAVVTVPANAVTAGVLLKHSAVGASEVTRFRRIKAIPLQFATPALGDGNVGSASDQTIYRYAATGLSDTSHTVQLTMAVGTTDITGINAHRPALTTPGVTVHRAGKSGTATVEHVGAGFSTNTKADLLVTTYEAVATPHLVVIALGANDYNRQDSSSITPAVFQTHMQTLVTKARTSGATVLLVAGPRWADDSKTHKQADYTAVLRNVAASNNGVAMIDLTETWGDYADANAAGFMYDSPHPNATGHADYARQLANVILG